MRRAIGVTDTIGAVEHSGDENESLAGISRLIRPSAPDVLVRRILGSVDMWHHGTYDDCHEHTGENEKATRATDEWKDPV